MTRYSLDTETHRLGTAPVVFGGAPPRLFRLTERGVVQFEAIARGDDVAPSALVSRMAAVGAIHPVPQPAPHRLAATTVIIPARDPDRRRLSSLVDEVAGVARVIVVDDGSRVPIDPIAGVDVIRNDEARGPGAARNTGLERCTTDFAVFVDCDVHVADGSAIVHLLGYFDDGSVALAAPRVLTALAPGRLAAYEEHHSPLDVGSGAGLVRPATRISFVPATMLVVRVAAIRDVGAFDEALRFGEDVDLVWRLVAAGWSCRYDTGVTIRHEPRSSWRAWARQRIDYGSSAAPLARRHPAALPAVRVTGWSPLVVVTAVLAGRRPGAALAAATTARTVHHLRKAGLHPGEAIVVAARMTARSHLQTASHAGEVIRRAWWPVVAVVSLRSRRARRLAAVAAVTAVVKAPRPTDLALRIVDDLLYGVGVWRGVVRLGEVRPLLPRFGQYRRTT